MKKASFFRDRKGCFFQLEHLSGFGLFIYIGVVIDKVLFIIEETPEKNVAPMNRRKFIGAYIYNSHIQNKGYL